MKGTYIFILFSLLINISIVGQTKTITIDDNNLTLKITSDGRIFQDLNGDPAFYKEGHENVNFLSSSGLLMYGSDPQGNIKVLENNRRTPVLPRLHAGLQYKKDSLALVDMIFDVSREEILRHIEDFKDNGIIDHPIEHIYSWPGRSNSVMPQFTDWNQELTEMNLAPFADLNHNEVYEPDLGEYPALANFDAMIYRMPKHIYWFATTAMDEQLVEAPQVNVYHTIYTYDCEEYDLLNNTIFINYDFYNYGLDDLHNLTITTMDRVDLGCSDQVRLKTDLGSRSWHAYRDDSCLQADNYKPVLSRYTYSNIPFFDVPTVFQGVLNPVVNGVTGIRHYYDFLEDDSFIINDIVDECRRIGEGLWQDGNPLVAIGDGYDPTSIDTSTYAFTGDVLRGTGWTELESNVPAGERWVATKTGRTLLGPGDRLFINTAYVVNAFAQAKPVNPLIYDQSIRMDNVFYGIDYEIDCAIRNGQLNTDVESLAYKIYPNPHLGEINVESAGNIKKIELYSIEGKYIKTIDQLGAKNKISMAQGIHLMKIYGPNGYIWEKVVGL